MQNGSAAQSNVHGQCDGAAISGSALLRTEALTKRFHGFTAVDGVTLDVMQGSIHALIGPNGAGKSTVFNLVTKFMQPTSGRIFYRGKDITRMRPEDVALKGLIRSFQVSAIFPHLSVRENVQIALQRPMKNWYKFWQSERRLAGLGERADELLEQVGLLGSGDVEAAQLSYGHRRALELATTLALEPELMLLDEPLAGMGREDVQHIAALIRRVAKGRTVLMVEHNLSVVSSLCDRITVLARGAVLAEGRYEEVSANAEVRSAYMGATHG
jgi:branched-chain amino acid transport system ATP-binding protein